MKGKLWLEGEVQRWQVREGVELQTDLLRRGRRGGSLLSRCRLFCIGRFSAGGRLCAPFL